jgi:hypothetical protein
MASPEIQPRRFCMISMPVSTEVRRCEVPAATSPWKQVVRPYAHLEQLGEQRRITRTDEFTPRSRTVWLPMGIPASARRSQAVRRQRCQLLGVIEVRVDVERVVPAQHRAQLVVDAHRQHDRNAGADADDLDMGNGAHGGDDLLQPRRRQRQRIAARDQDVPDRRRAPDVVDGLAQVLAARWAIPPGPPGGGGCSAGSRWRSDRRPAAGNDRE